MKLNPLLGAAVLPVLLACGCSSAQHHKDAPPAGISALSPNDVVQMVHNHVDDGLIINQIRTSGTVFHLSAGEITWLKQNGVSDAVVVAMQATANQPPPPPPPAPVSTVYVEPAPPVFIGVGYHRRWR
jgi:hypothetical protein